MHACILSFHRFLLSNYLCWHCGIHSRSPGTDGLVGVRVEEAIIKRWGWNKHKQMRKVNLNGMAIPMGKKQSRPRGSVSGRWYRQQPDWRKESAMERSWETEFTQREGLPKWGPRGWEERLLRMQSGEATMAGWRTVCRAGKSWRERQGLRCLVLSAHD